ncbi:MAG: purine-nucleoside phosphorylase [Planctomycetes bacterium]|nr:purine-nucleoside phosphorylase [Planctomycetota bacterium]
MTDPWPNPALPHDFLPALAHLKRRGFGETVPTVALILGSGFGDVEQAVDDPLRCPYSDLPGFPAPAGTAGHVCRLSQGGLWGVNALVFRGRYHAYEGHAPRDLAACVWVAHGLGARTLVVTNAAGGIRPDLVPGSLMAIRDHLNLMGVNPLVGPQRLAGAAAFPPMGAAYDADLLGQLLKAGNAVGEKVTPGVYAAVLGPSFETPAEVEMLRRLGADAVGMSTIPEVITAGALGMRACGLSLITNRAGSAHDSHQQVLQAAGANADRVAGVLRALLQKLGQA